MYTTKTKFNEFINFYNKEYYSSKLMNNRSKGLWNPKRQDYLKQYNNNRTSFLSELEEIEAKSFSDLVPNEFFSEKKSKNIFSNFLGELSQETSKNKNGLLTIDCCSIIAEQKEEYEMIKRNLNKYMDYIMDKNFFLMKYYTKNINLFYLKIEDALVKIELLKKKMNFIKKKYFLVHSKIYMKHQKLKNCKNIYYNLIKIREFKKLYLSINSNKNTNYKIIGKTIETKSKFNKTEELIKKIERFKYYNKSLICFWFIQNLQVNQNDYKDNYEELLSKLFLTKVTFDEFSSIYDIYFSLNNKNKNIKEINNELLNKIILFYKKDIFNMIKGILLSYATIDYTESMNSNMILKLKQLQNLSFEERKLFLAINQICITILSFCDNIYTYLNSNEYRNTKLGQILYVNRKMLYNIINKKLKKILCLYTDLILNFQNESNIYLILSSISLAYAYIEKSFQIEEINDNHNTNTNIKNNIIDQNKKIMTSKINNNNNKGHNLIKKISVNNNKIIKKTKINLNVNNTINLENNNSKINLNKVNNILKTELNNFYIKLAFSLLKQKIKNLSIYLSKDNWKKINIHNLYEYINKKSIKIIKFKDLLNLPYRNINIDKNEIKNQITNLINHKEAKNIKINLYNLFNKKLNERNLIFSSSSFYLFQYILDIYTYSLIIPTIKNDILKYMLNIYDYFIYSTILMFHQDKINIEEISQKIILNKNINSLSYDDLLKKSKDIEYIRNYINLISFLIECKKGFLVKVVGNEKALFTILPILNSQILVSDKKDNNLNTNNYIEKIICYECYWTIFKIIKRMIPINNNGKNEIYNTQINKYKIILNEIKHFIYYPISLHMIKNDSYVNYFFNNDWNINNNNKKIGNKKSAYIQIMIENIKEINDKLTMFLPISLKARIRFIYIFLILMLDKIKEKINKISNLNNGMINTIIQDLKLFLKNLTEIINCNDNGNEINNKSKINLFENVLNNFIECLNNAFLNKDKFLNSVGKNKTPWNLINSLLNMNKFISNNEKEKIKLDLKCIYIKELQIIIDILRKNE